MINEKDSAILTPKEEIKKRVDTPGEINTQKCSILEGRGGDPLVGKFPGEIGLLKKGAHIYLMGICGTAMASLASLLKDRGFKVTGSDRNVYPPMSTFLEQKGIPIFDGYRPENLDSQPDYVVVGNVISKHFPEAQALLERQIPFGSLPQTMGDLIIEDRHSVVVCGTHGKTTTTSLAAWTAACAGLAPGFMIGGIAKNFGTSAKNPEGSWFVIEGDEYDSAFFAKVPKFTFYKPQSAILTSIEFDHADIYPDMQGIFQAFQPLLSLLPKDGLLVYNGEDPNIAKLLQGQKGKKWAAENGAVCPNAHESHGGEPLGSASGFKAVSYGRCEGAWTLGAVEPVKEGLRFVVKYQGQKESEHFLPMFGEYNALNALSVYALYKELGVDVDWDKSFGQFQGIKRRQELLGSPGGVQVIEDFAHHPTAVGATLQSFKRRLQHLGGKGRLLALFEPRSATSRRNYFQDEYAEALAFADSVYVAKPFDAKELGDQALDIDQLVLDLKGRGVSARGFLKVEEILEELGGEAMPGDTLVIMSNGGFQQVYQKILNQLQSR